MNQITATYPQAVRTPIGTVTEVREQRGSGISGALKRISPEDIQAECTQPSSAKAETFAIRKIANRDELDTVYRLTHDAYLDYGYITPQPNGRFCHAKHLDASPLTDIWVMQKGRTIIGTGSMTLDGPHGMIMEKEFARELAEVRKENRRISCVWRLAIDRDHRCINRVVVQLITHLIKMAMTKCDTLLFVVNPRHAGYYERLLKMRKLGIRDTVLELNNAPAVLLRWDTDQCPLRWMQVKQPAAAAK